MSDARDIWRAIQRIGDDLERLRKADAGAVTVAYTPTYIGGTTPGATTYSFQSGTYALFGPIVVVTGQIVWTAATGTGAATISLPLAAIAVNFSGYMRLDSVTFANSAPEMLITGSGSSFVMDSPITNAGPTRVAVETAGSIVFTCIYFTG